MRGFGQEVGVALLIVGLFVAGFFIWTGQEDVLFSPNSCEGDPTQLILALSAESNAHAERYDQGNYSIEVCYDKYFDGRGEGRRGGGSGNVLFLSDYTNAHAADPKNQGSYVIPVKYDDLDCNLQNTADSCAPINGKPAARILLLSDTTNAHLALIGRANYPKMLCCSAGDDLICNNNDICEPNRGENVNNCNDCKEETVPLVSLDFQGRGHTTANDWTPVYPDDDEYEWDVEVEGIKCESNCGTLPEPTDAYVDFHRVSGSKFTIGLENENELKFSISIKYGAGSEASAPFSVKVNGENFGNGEAKNAGEFGSLNGDVEASELLEIEFTHSSNIAISGIVVGGYCGNDVVEGDEQCDDGDNENGDGCSEFCLNEEGGGGDDFCKDYEPYTKAYDDGENLIDIEICDDYNKVRDEDVNGLDYDGTPDEFREECCDLDCADAYQNEPLRYSCKWSELGNKCESVFVDGGIECRLDYKYDGECGPEDSFRDVNISVINITGPVEECAGPCDGQPNCVRQIQCPRVIELPFFNTINFVVVLTMIGLIYVFKYRKEVK